MAARSPAQAAYSAAALLYTFALLSSFAHAQCGGFALSCSGIDVSAQGVLTAICGDGRGGYNRAALDLNQHISNNNGNLVDGAGFVATCRNIRRYQLGTDNQGVAAECTKADGTTGSTTLYNVEAKVVNNFGILFFNRCRRRALLDTSSITSRKMLHL